jgi:hypothetical protein
MAYTDIDKPSDYFNTVLYTGTGSSNAITGVGFQPDLLWFKNRGSALNHIWFDSVRGIDKYFYGNLTEAEGTSATILTAVGSDGFTVGANNNVNQSSNGIVAWNWLANGAGVSNTDGSITSTVSANTTSGFSIVNWTGVGGASTVGHGLSQTPEMIFIKRRPSTGAWIVYNKTIGATKYLHLNSTAASSSYLYYFNNTEPTSSVFTVGDDGEVNGTSSNNYVAYCFSSVKGYSKIGSYTGNGNANGTFVYTGFRPAFVLVKNTSTAGTNWQIVDNKRVGYNGANHRLYTDDSAAESTTQTLDILSNGFKAITTNNLVNASGSTYIYMAFASQPFTTSTGIPATAR